MPSSPIEKLSAEPILQIVGWVKFLAYDTQDLCNLSLTARAFGGPCRVYLFEALKIELGPASKLATLCEIFERDPTIPGHVRRLSIMFIQPWNSWIFNDTNFMKIVQALSQSSQPVNSLKLGGRGPLLSFEDPALLVAGWRNFNSRDLLPYIDGILASLLAPHTQINYRWIPPRPTPGPISGLI
ncbi:hypothetical protein BKA70DRAFT_1223044 [Coprinopsis sp. MPI-PUGE-AT-0042]|nr:hypothetical protein BKA70DRAFT_1223044 [Coprinopsis sp. MPI-PUGE-AT-0042]